MDVPKYYISLPHNLAGSRSKNRFRLELLWGISKMLDLMAENKEFTFIFDYVCDVEILFADKLEFYQIKTHKPHTPPYTCKKLVQKETPKAEGSILGKLYVLNQGDSAELKLVIVSNVSIKCGENNIDFGEISLSAFPEQEKQIVENALKNELHISEVDLSKVFYLFTSMNLENPVNEIKGKIVGTFSQIKQCEPNNPNALYRLIFDTVEDKACYEYSEKEFKEIVEKKGITSEEFNQILDAHAKNEKTGIKQAYEYIEGLENVLQIRKHNKALAKLLRLLPSSRPLHALEKKISAYLANSDCGSRDETIERLREQFNDQFPMEYDEEMKVLFLVIVEGRFEQGAYDDEIAL